MPINQFVYFDCLEVVKRNEEKGKENDLTEIEEIRKVKVKNDRLDGLRKCLGEKVVEKIRNARLFMVGSGAIGCELLKNYAMMSLGTGNYYTLDVIH